METRDMAKKGLYIGTGTGIILFALLGVLPGSFVGGLIGLKVAGAIFGMPLAATILPRLIVAVSMIFGVMTAAVVFILGAGVLGWSLGFVADSVMAVRTVGEPARQAVK